MQKLKLPENRLFGRVWNLLWSYTVPVALGVLGIILAVVDGSFLSGFILLVLAAYFVPAIRNVRKRLPKAVNIVIFLALVAAFYFSMYLYI